MGAALFVTDGCRPLRFSSVDGDAMMENAADVVACLCCFDLIAIGWAG
jgi:hypothetical protein